MKKSMLVTLLLSAAAAQADSTPKFDAKNLSQDVKVLASDEFDGRGVRIAVWCFGPEGHLPLGDVMLAQKLALETDEQAALAIANRNSGTYPGSNWSQSSREASDDCLCCFNHDPGSGNLESISRTTGAV